MHVSLTNTPPPPLHTHTAYAGMECQLLFSELFFLNWLHGARAANQNELDDVWTWKDQQQFKAGGHGKMSLIVNLANTD